MRAYGLPRNLNIESPDLGDICEYGLKTGRIHPRWNHACNCKSRVRRFWKKRERRWAKTNLRNTGE